MNHQHKFIQKSFALISFVVLFSLLASCRKDPVLQKSITTQLGKEDFDFGEGEQKGLYLLCEGNMGSNKATIDFLNFSDGTYHRNIYAERNPNVAKELGDVGNDIMIYGSKMYVVVNASHKVEILDKHTAKQIKKLDIANCRSLTFRNGKVYVSSYVGEIKLNDPKSPLGEVVRIDTTSLEIDGRVSVGYQPEDMAVVGSYLYVANSGGYRAPNYDDRLSVIRLSDFKVVDNIKLGVNLSKIVKDKKQQLWVSSRGDYGNQKSCIFLLKYNQQTGREELAKRIETPCSAMALKDDKLLVIATEWDKAQAKNSISYHQIDTETAQLLGGDFITDGTEEEITMPYGIAVNPETKEIYIADAKNYVSSGTLHCYSPQGKRLWTVQTGDIPAHFAFLK